MFLEQLPVFVDLSHPGYLAVLALLPVVIVLSLRSLAGLGQVRGSIAVGLRCLLIAVLALALASPGWVRTTDHQTVVFVLDQSDSVPQSQQREAMAFVERAALSIRAGKDQVAVLSFAGRPSIDQLPRATLVTPGSGTVADRHRTSIAAALRLGTALFPSDAAKRLVLISDGNENRGLAAEEAEAYAALGVPIDVVPLHYEHTAEVLVDQLSAPARAKHDEVINLQLVVRSQVAMAARLTLYRNDRLVDLDPTTGGTTSSIRLSAGPNRFSIPVGLHAAGVHRFRAVIEPEDPAADSIVVNNEGQAFTIVGAARRIVIVLNPAGHDAETHIASAELLANALREGGVQCDLITLDDLPRDPAALADTAAIILSNISAFDLGSARQTLLASYVRDQGGGLIVIGGDEAFSVGGYAHTPLEEVLPVETSRDKLLFLSLSMVIVIDRSGSMAGEKIAMARKAAIGSVELLSRQDRVGVVAFDGAAEWLVPLQSASNRAAIVQRLATLGGGGGTNMYPALEQARAALLGVNTNLKHIIVLTDGQSAPGPFDALAKDCGNAGITISAIAVGPDADRTLLAGIAQRSGGRMYTASSARPLPQIFARETILASRSGLFEQPFTPHMQPTVDHQIMSGFVAELPPLRGHVVTAAKPMAHVPLVRSTEDGADPILAYWQVGLGRTVAFTSGLWPRWGPDWVAWPGFSKFWTQAVQYAGRTSHPGDLEVATTVRGGNAHVSILAEHLPLRAQDTLTVNGRIIAPDYSSSPLPLHRTAAGRYEAVFPLAAPGTYLLNLPYSYGFGQARQSGVLRTGVVQSYSPEYRTLRHNETTLTELARRTGGRVLNPDYPEAVFEPWSIRPVQIRRPFWEDLVRLALVLFLLDVAVRRIAVTPAEAFTRVRRFIGDLAGSRPDADSLATLGALRGARKRAQLSAQDTAGTTPAMPPAPTPQPSLDPKPDDALSQALNGTDEDKPVIAKPLHRKPASTRSEAEYTSRLLRAKQRARRHDGGRDDR